MVVNVFMVHYEKYGGVTHMSGFYVDISEGLVIRI